MFISSLVASAYKKALREKHEKPFYQTVSNIFSVIK